MRNLKGQFIKGNSINKGRIRPKEVRNKISLGRLGMKFTQQHKNRISESMKGEKNFMFGKKHNDESKKKMSQNSKVLRGPENNKWKGGISTYERKLWLNNQRRIKKNGISGFHTQGDWERLKTQYNWTCPSCKKFEPTIKLTEDHIIPISKGGSDNIENIQPLCKSCNSRKHNKIIEKYDK